MVRAAGRGHEVIRCGVLVMIGIAAAASAEEEKKPRLALAFGGLWVTPLLGPAYTPELGFVVAGGTLISYRFDEESPRSSAPIALSIGTVGATQFTVKPTMYFLADQLRVDAYLGLKSMTDQYFGVGYAAGNATPMGEATTQYHREMTQLNGSILTRIRQDLYFGGSFDINSTDASQLAPQMAQDQHVLEQGTYFVDRGVGPILRYDSRDLPENAFEGMFVEAKWLLYREMLGGTTHFNTFSLDYRQYHTLSRPGITLAWNVKTRTGSGDVPWTDLPGLGSSGDLRGYREGRYRDRTTIYALLELRWMDLKSYDANGEAQFGLNGLVTWIGAGTMGSGYDHLNCLLPNFGVGYRLRVQGRMAVRIDMGAGRESTAFYFSFNEAF